MKAYEISEPGKIEKKPNCQDPQIEDSESVLLKTERVSICATDVAYYKGDLSPPSWPIIPGHEYVGRVAEVGENVALEKGERIAYWGQSDFGGLAEYRVIRPLLPGKRLPESKKKIYFYDDRGFIDARYAAAIRPSDIPLDHAPILEPVTSVLRSLYKFADELRRIDNAMVLGAGACGLIALQLLKKKYDINHISVLDKNESRLEIAERWAESTYNVDDEREELEKKAKESKGDFTELVFDTLPDISDDPNLPNTRTIAMKLLSPNNLYILYGVSEKEQPIDLRLLLVKGLKLGAAPFDQRAFSMSKSQTALMTAERSLSNGTVEADSIITDYADFEKKNQVTSAFERHGQGERLKTVVRFED